MNQACRLATLMLTVLVPAQLQGADAEPRTLQGHQGSVLAVSFSPDGKIVASGCKDTTIKFWDPQTGSLRQTLTGPKNRLESLAFSPDGQTLASGSGGPESLIWLWPVARPPK
jgi:WD40 repeat protein